MVVLAPGDQVRVPIQCPFWEWFHRDRLIDEILGDESFVAVAELLGQMAVAEQDPTAFWCSA